MALFDTHCQTAITVFLQWSKRLDDVFDKSKKLVPVQLRQSKLQYAVPAKSLCSYRTKEARTVLYGNARAAH